MNGNESNPIIIVLKLNCNKINNEKDKSINNKIKASSIFIFFDVKGLFTVLSIFLSILISIKSFIIYIDDVTKKNYLADWAFSTKTLKVSG